MSDARTQLLGDYGRKRCRWQPVILTGIVAEYRLSVGTGWHERLRVGNDKRINCDGREGDGDELAYATSRVFSCNVQN